MSDVEYEVYGGKVDGVYVVSQPGGPVIAAFYAVPGSPDWWRGHSFGKVRQLYLPGVDPVDVAGRFIT